MFKGFEGPDTADAELVAAASASKNAPKKIGAAAVAKAALTKAKPPIPHMKKPAAAKVAAKIAVAAKAEVAKDTETQPKLGQADVVLELCKARLSKALWSDGSVDEATSNSICSDAEHERDYWAIGSLL